MTVTISGTSGVSLCDTNSVPTAAIQASAITQPKVATAVAGTGPAFAAYATTGLSLSNNTWTKIPLQAKYFDTASAFDNTTNYRFQPTIAGYYQINGAISNGAFNGGVAAAGIYKNGTVIAKSLITNGGQGTINTVSTIVSLNGSTDYIELYGFQNSGGSLSTASSADTNLSGALVRSA